VRTRIRKDIWTNDRVKITAGRFIGREGVVTQRVPKFKYLAHFVWVRFDGVKGGTTGPKIHVKNVQLMEMCSGHRKEKRSREQRATCKESDEASGREE
jgi:ribosomal protein L24